MGIENRSSSKAITNVHYSAFLGMLYVSTPESEAAIEDAKTKIGGEAVVKEGFKGDRGNAPSAQALQMLAAQGVKPVKCSGTLTSAYVRSFDKDGHQLHYLTVNVSDKDGSVRLSVGLDQPAAQMLVRKLVNAEPGVQTEFSLFAAMEQRDGAPRAYANHFASLKQEGAKVEGVDPQSVLAPRIAEAQAKLRAAGFADKEMLAKCADKVELEYHFSLMQAVDAEFKQWYEARKQQQSQQAPQPQTDPVAA
jgi:hypothetical protein